jgi:hypothetical protein
MLDERAGQFLGATQSKISVELARALQPFGPDVEYIQIDGNGLNALDFHIAYYVGRLAAEYPEPTSMSFPKTRDSTR